MFPPADVPAPPPVSREPGSPRAPLARHDSITLEIGGDGPRHARSPFPEGR